MLQLIEAKLSLFKKLWPRGIFKYFILIEIAINLTINIIFHEKFYLKIKGIQLLAHWKNQLDYWIEKMHRHVYVTSIIRKNSETQK